MDKRETLKQIAFQLLKVESNIIDGKDLDKLIFKKAQKLDKNVKYEFRQYLMIYDLINQYQSPEIRQNDAFIIEKKQIKKFLEKGG